MVGIVSFVHGWYVDYIPLHIYSVLRAYPNYFVKVLVHHELPDYIKKSLSLLPDSSFVVLENVLSDKGKYDNPEKKPYYLRWILPQSYVCEFDKVFMCDIDYLMLPEDVPMHEKRDAICKAHSLPFANYVRRPQKNIPPKVTGWHYYHTQPYYSAIGEVADKILNDTTFDISNPPSYQYDNGMGEKQWGQESLLYNLLKKSFLFEDKHLRHEFPTHHGLHLGPFRGTIPELVIKGNKKAIKHIGLNIKYWNMQKEIRSLLRDSIFRRLCAIIKNEKTQMVMGKVLSNYTKLNNR